MKLTKPNTSAAGIPAVVNALKMAFQSVNPVKAFKILNSLNQEDGIDCPGCAWPDPAHRSRLGEYCENGVKAIAEEAMDASAGTAFFEEHSIEFLRKQSDYWLGQQGRLVRPMLIKKEDSHYTPVAWETAFTLIAEQLKSLPKPDDAIFYTSGRTSNEAAYLYQLFTRMFGTNNLPDCSNMCHESSGTALSNTLGIGKGSVKLEDFYESELILIFGQNPATNHPRMLAALEKAKENGAKVVVVNPLIEAGLVNFKNPQNIKGVLAGGTAIADLYLQININEDAALLKYLMLRLLENSKESSNVIDTEFIAQNTVGFEKFAEALQKEDLQNLLKRTGLPKEAVEAFVELLTHRSKIIACWCMGITQHENGVDNIQDIVNLLLLKGSIGKPGAGTCPVRGHSNVQGDRTMGIFEKPSKQLLDSLATTFDFEPSRKDGVDVVESIELMYAEKGKVFMAMGGNFLGAAPDTKITQQALENCDLTVHVSTKLNRSHLHSGKMGLILPCLGRTDIIEEKSGVQKLTVENSMGLVHSTQGNQKARSEDLLSEPHIIAQIAAKTLGNGKVNWTGLIDNYDAIRDLIAKSIQGFENFNQKLKTQKIIELPNGPRRGKFTTDIGKAKFTINKMSAIQLEKEELLMMTIRSHDQYNTTIYGLDDRYRGIYGTRDVILMNEKDIERLELNTSKKVTVFNNYDSVYREVTGLTLVPYNIPVGCVATYFPECNALIPLSETARKSNTPASKSIKVKIAQKNI